MKIIVASAYVPFTGDRWARVADDLAAELMRAGHRADVVKIPLHPDWRRLPEQTLGIRLLDLTAASGDPVDRLITLRSPSQALTHPNKVAWLTQHHRGAYDLWATGRGDMPEDYEARCARDVVRQTDGIYLGEARRVFAASRSLADRLREFNGVEPAGVLYPPLPRHHPYREGELGDYLLCTGRLCPPERQALAVEALRDCRPAVRLVLAGAPESPAYLDRLKELARRDGVEGRVRFTGAVSGQQEADLLAGCRGALCLGPGEGCYADSLLAACHSGKVVITLRDSGAAPELVEHGGNGLVAEPEARALADAMDRLWDDRARTLRMGANARRTPAGRGITWDHVVESLTA